MVLVLIVVEFHTVCEKPHADREAWSQIDVQLKRVGMT